MRNGYSGIYQGVTMIETPMRLGLTGLVTGPPHYEGPAHYKPGPFTLRL